MISIVQHKHIPEADPFSTALEEIPDLDKVRPRKRARIGGFEQCIVECIVPMLDWYRVAPQHKITHVRELELNLHPSKLQHFSERYGYLHSWRCIFTDSSDNKFDFDLGSATDEHIIFIINRDMVGSCRVEIIGYQNVGNPDDEDDAGYPLFSEMPFDVQELLEELEDGGSSITIHDMFSGSSATIHS
jgi:hypothetical protein